MAKKRRGKKKFWLKKDLLSRAQ